MWRLVGRRLSYEEFRADRSLEVARFSSTGSTRANYPDDCDRPSRSVLVRLGEVRPAPRSIERRWTRAPYLHDTSELKYHWARHISDVEARAVPIHGAYFLCHADSGQCGRVGQGSVGSGSPRDTDVTVPLDCSPPNRARLPRSGIQVVAAEATGVPAPECGGGAVAPEL